MAKSSLDVHTVAYTGANVTVIAKGYGGPLVKRHGHLQSADNGGPLQNQKITAKSKTDTTVGTTDKHGRVVLQLEPGRYQVWACQGEVTKLTVTADTSQATVHVRCDFP